MARETHPKWEGKVTATIRTATAEQIWPFLADFCNLHAWNQHLETCHQAGGTSGEPGLIRYCAGKSVSAEDGAGIAWSLEKLLSIHPEERLLSYEVVENNIGFGSYVAKQRVVEKDEGCEIEWGFLADPVQGWNLDDFVSYLESALRSMAEKMENAVKSATATASLDQSTFNHGLKSGTV